MYSSVNQIGVKRELEAVKREDKKKIELQKLRSKNPGNSHQIVSLLLFHPATYAVATYIGIFFCFVITCIRMRKIFFLDSHFRVE